MFIKLAIYFELIVYLLLKVVPFDLPYPFSKSHIETEIIGCHFLLNGKFNLPPDVEKHYLLKGKMLFALGMLVIFCVLTKIIEIFVQIG